MVNTTEICCTAICTVISIGILMALSSSVAQTPREKALMVLSPSAAQTTREKVHTETVYGDRVQKVYGDRFEKVYTDRNGQPIYCDDRGGDCIRPCGGATCAVLVFPQGPRTAQPAQGQPETPQPSPR